MIGLDPNVTAGLTGGSAVPFMTPSQTLASAVLHELAGTSPKVEAGEVIEILDTRFALLSRAAKTRLAAKHEIIRELGITHYAPERLPHGVTVKDLAEYMWMQSADGKQQNLRHPLRNLEFFPNMPADFSPLAAERALSNAEFHLASERSELNQDEREILYTTLQIARQFSWYCYADQFGGPSLFPLGSEAMQISRKKIGSLIIEATGGADRQSARLELRKEIVDLLHRALNLSEAEQSRKKEITNIVLHITTVAWTVDKANYGTSPDLRDVRFAMFDGICQMSNMLKRYAPNDCRTYQAYKDPS